MKKDKLSGLNMSHEKMSDFLSFWLSGLTLAIKLTNLDIVSHWNTSICFDKKKDMESNLNMCQLKMSHSISFSFFGFTLVVKMRNYNFESLWKYFNIFW